MLPIDAFRSIWLRADELRAIHSYLSAHVTAALNPAELLRAEWVCRVSALDLYVHEIVSQRMLETFIGQRPEAKGFGKFQLSAALLTQIRAAPLIQSQALFDLEVRTKLSLLSFQDPDKIADGIRMISDVELWNDVAVALGATTQSKIGDAKNLRKQLSLIVQRRNKIAHEGDLQPIIPRDVWPIAVSDVEFVKVFLDKIVTAIDAVVP